MKQKYAYLGLSVATVALAAAPSSADDKEKERAAPKVEQLKELPSTIRLPSERTRAESPSLSVVLFLRPGSDEILQSVAAGAKFDVLIALDRPATSAVDITVVPFRLDVTGLGSGQVKVIPIVVGSGADEKYWDTPPPSPVRNQAGFYAVRVPGGRVLRNAKQPPGGDVTQPFAPISFPDHVIMFVRQGNALLAPTLRVTAP